MEAHRFDDEVVFSIRRPALGLVFEVGGSSNFIHTVDTDDDEHELMEWLRADPVRWEAYGLLAQAANLLFGDVLSDAQRSDALGESQP